MHYLDYCGGGGAGVGGAANFSKKATEAVEEENMLCRLGKMSCLQLLTYGQGKS